MDGVRRNGTAGLRQRHDLAGLDDAMFMGWMNSTSSTAIPPAIGLLSDEIISIPGGSGFALLAAKQAHATTVTAA